MSDNLAEVLRSVEGLGREVHRDVTLGTHTFTLKPISTDQEIECYQYAGELAGGVPSMEREGLKIGPEYLWYVKVALLSRAVHAIDGVEVPPDAEVEDLSGTRREVFSYLHRIFGSWPSEVLDYVFMEYNRLQVQVSESYDFTMAHRAVMSSLDQLLRINAENLKTLAENDEKLGSEDVSDEEPDSGGRTGA